MDSSIQYALVIDDANGDDYNMQVLIEMYGIEMGELMLLTAVQEVLPLNSLPCQIKGNIFEEKIITFLQSFIKRLK